MSSSSSFLPSCLLPSLTGFRNDFRRFLSPFHTSTHCPILFFPLELIFHSSLFLLLFSLNPLCLPSFHFISSPPFKSPLSSVHLLPSISPSFSAPVEYYRMFSSLPPALHRLLLFLSKISSWYPSFIPPFSLPAVFYSFFSPHCTLTRPPRILISQSFMVTLLLSPPLNVSLSLCIFLLHPPPPTVPLPLVSFPLLLIS